MQPPDQYRPSPIQTSDDDLAPELNALLERLAENVHDHWALLRMQQGWTWGRQRSDEARTNPCLVPYSELSEAEKEADRRTARETLKATVALGYRIVAPEQL